MNRISVLIAALALIGSSMSAALAQANCTMPDSFNDPHPVMHDGPQTMFWVRPLQVDADGARNAYHRDDPHGSRGKAIEYIGNGMTITRDGEPLEFKLKEEENSEWLDAYRMIVKNGWKAPAGWGVDIYGFARRNDGKACLKEDGRLISTTSLVQHPKARNCDPRRYIDALKLPGIVVPNRTADEKPTRGDDQEVAPPFARRGVSRGDLAIVYNPETRIWKGAFIYDTGPRHLLGEGSLRLVLDLRARPHAPTSALDTNSLGIVETNVLVFPGTAARLGPGRTWTQDKIQALAAEQFRKWAGGSESEALDKMLACAEHYKSKFR
jgi:hypothetical protein